LDRFLSSMNFPHIYFYLLHFLSHFLYLKNVEFNLLLLYCQLAAQLVSLFHYCINVSCAKKGENISPRNEEGGKLMGTHRSCSTSCLVRIGNVSELLTRSLTMERGGETKVHTHSLSLLPKRCCSLQLSESRFCLNMERATLSFSVLE